jgi:GNAT superfamily N-acetyltransferase
MATTIARERPDSPDAAALIAELDAYLIPLYPLEAHYGYDVEKLLREDVAFFVVRQDGLAAGCGGVLLFDDYGEIKRMYVRPAFRSLGLAKRMLEHLEGYVLERGITLLRLETGIYQPEALGLYERSGFQRCAAFGEYPPDGQYNVFYEKRISHAVS